MHSAILSTFIKLPFAIKTFVLSIFEWILKTGFTVSGITFKFPVDQYVIFTNLEKIKKKRKFNFYVYCATYMYVKLIIINFIKRFEKKKRLVEHLSLFGDKLNTSNNTV